MKHPVRVVREYYKTVEHSSDPICYGDYVVTKYKEKLQYRNEKGKWVDVPVFNSNRKRYEK